MKTRTYHNLATLKPLLNHTTCARSGPRTYEPSNHRQRVRKPAHHIAQRFPAQLSKLPDLGRPLSPTITSQQPYRHQIYPCKVNNRWPITLGSIGSESNPKLDERQHRILPLNHRYDTLNRPQDLAKSKSSQFFVISLKFLRASFVYHTQAHPPRPLSLTRS